jgi:hypothetical protein
MIKPSTGSISIAMTPDVMRRGPTTRRAVWWVGVGSKRKKWTETTRKIQYMQ